MDVSKLLFEMENKINLIFVDVILFIKEKEKQLKNPEENIYSPRKMNFIIINYFSIVFLVLLRVLPLFFHFHFF